MSHARDEIPDFILLAHYEDDTHVVICHYHHIPIESELNEMCKAYFNSGDSAKGLIRFQFTQVRFDAMPETLELKTPSKAH